MNPLISPRTRTWPNALSIVRLSAPDSSVTVSAGELSPGATFANRPARVSSGRSMNILLLGSGGREDALAWRLRQSPSCGKLLAAPGNPGHRALGRLRRIDPCDAAAVVDLARDERRSTWSWSAPKRRWSPASPTPCAPPASPSSARMPPRRSSKARRASPRTCAAPTASRPPIMSASTTRAEALAALDRFGLPVVIKADGLAAGKGVTVAMTREEAEAAIDAAGDGPLVIEEFLEGEEASLFALVDGETAVPLASAQDHKRVGEGDTGPNTGGMGAYAPAPVLTPELQQRAMDEIVRPTARALAAGGNAVQRRALCRADADRRRPQADRI